MNNHALNQANVTQPPQSPTTRVVPLNYHSDRPVRLTHHAVKSQPLLPPTKYLSPASYYLELVTYIFVANVNLD